MISFESNCNKITNPFLSECGRFETSPAIYGFVQQDTVFTVQKDGKGGRAWVKTFVETGMQIRLTTRDGRSVPANAEEAWIELIDTRPLFKFVEREQVPLPGTLGPYASSLSHMNDVYICLDMERLPIDSANGVECVKVLDAANAFIATMPGSANMIRRLAETELRAINYGFREHLHNFPQWWS